jgi:hypothetical protein
MGGRVATVRHSAHALSPRTCAYLPATQCAPLLKVARHLTPAGELLLAAAASLAAPGCSSKGGNSADDVACAIVDDCYGTAIATGNSVYCCLNKKCAFSGSTLLIDCTDANVQRIQSSNYDQSCKTDSDCVAVSEGNACYPGFLNCPTATINVGAQSQYNADVARTNAGVCVALSSCVDEPGPCCRGGTCVTDQCFIVADAGTRAPSKAR